MQINSTEELFQDELQRLHSIESQIVNAIPRLIENARSDKLKNALSSHLEETRNQAKRLEDIGQEMDVSFDGMQDMGMKAILEEGESTLQDVTNPELKDTVIIGGSDKVEHYEMAAYESALVLAKQLGHDDIADALQETYNEEKRTADLLKGMVQGGMAEMTATVKQAVP